MTFELAPPVVTVVIPVYNSAATLARAVQSVLDQSCAQFELLIVDDGSTDASLATARDLAKSDGRITVVALARNGGKARAMNHATSLARGTWIAVLDADDRYLPDRLGSLIAAAEANGVDLVADNQLHRDDATGRLHRYAFKAAGTGREVRLADFIAHSDPGASFDFGILKPVVRADFLRRTNLAYHPEARLAEDFYFMLDFFALGGRAWLVHAALYEWTLPFSPTARLWTTTGSGAWRYDYRGALEVNRDIQQRLGPDARPEIVALLRRREREYAVMIPYLDAQRVLTETGSLRHAMAIIVSHPGTWRLLARRIVGRLARTMRPRPTALASGA